jgi:hypothetical protein
MYGAPVALAAALSSHPLFMLVTMNLVISCDECAMQHTNHCQDCVVTFLCDESTGAVIIDADEQRAVRMLSRAGLVPILRHCPQTTCA